MWLEDGLGSIFSGILGSAVSSLLSGGVMFELALVMLLFIFVETAFHRLVDKII